MAERINWVDFAKGVAIILMVLGHAVYNDLQKFIFVFHMPFFFIMAGFLLNFEKWGGRKLQRLRGETFQATARAVLLGKLFVVPDLVCPLP